LILVKYPLEDFSPVGVAFFQAAIGAAGLLAIVLYECGRAHQMVGAILRRSLPALLLGLFAIAVPFILISLGRFSLPSGLGGVLVSSIPMFVAVFAPCLDRGVEINRIQLAWLVVGLVGVALVVGLQSVSSVGQFLDTLAILGAAASGALASFVVKLQYRDKNVPPSTTSLFSLGVGAVIVAPFAAITAPKTTRRRYDTGRDCARPLLHGAHVHALLRPHHRDGGGARGPGELHNPYLRALYGVLFLGEALTLAYVLGLALIVAGAEITLRGPRSKGAGDEAKALRYRPPRLSIPRPQARDPPSTVSTGSHPQRCGTKTRGVRYCEHFRGKGLGSSVGGRYASRTQGTKERTAAVAHRRR
jgi:drug/metabolite transporter (DMT)-like permease